VGSARAELVEPNEVLGQRLAAYARHVSSPYVEFLRRHNLELDVARAEGAVVYDARGRRYVDCIAGYGNLNIGHNHPAVVEAVVREIESARPFNWPFVSEAHVRLVQRLASVAPGDPGNCLLVNSGSEAVESALKLVRLATGRNKVVSMRGAWHGFTLGAMSVSEPSLCRAFRPLLEGVTHVPFGDITALEQALDDDTGAVILEPMQAESGALLPPAGYLRAVEALCRRNDVVFILDEAKTGIGKTGRLFACEHESVVPDILITGKSLGGGVMPIGALVASDSLWGRFGLSFPMSSSSGAGNAPACAAGLATLDVVESSQLCLSAERRGAQIKAALEGLGRDEPSVLRSTSGQGLLIGVQVDSSKNASRIVAECAARGVLVMTAFCDRTRILIEPPLCIDSEQVAVAIEAFCDAVKTVSSESKSRA